MARRIYHKKMLPSFEIGGFVGQLAISLIISNGTAVFSITFLNSSLVSAHSTRST